MTRSSPRLWLTALAMSLAAWGGLSGCGSNPYPGETAQTLHVYVDLLIKSLDPALAGDQTSSICVLNIYDQLFEYEYLERPFTLKPCLAAAMPEISEDRLTYTIRLKKGVRYVDDDCWGGKPVRSVTAHDVVFCLKRLMDTRTKSTGTWIFDGKIVGLDAFRKASADIAKNPNRSKYTKADGYPAVAGLRALDEHTVQFKLLEPYPQFIWTLAMGYTSVYAPEAVAHYGKHFMRSGVGTGPYTIESINLSKKIVLTRNPHYREDTFPEPRTDTEAHRARTEDDRSRNRLADVGKRLPLNDRVVLTVFNAAPQPLWLYFQRGYLDRTGIPNDNFDTAVDSKTFELLPSMKARGIHLDKDPRMEVVYDCFNMEDEVVGKPAGEKGRAIRRAISLATDNEWAFKHLYSGRAKRVDGPIVEEFAEFDPTFRNPWKKRADETREQVLERARKVLADAGYPGGKGIPVIEKDIIDSDVSRTHFLAFKRDVAEVGIRVKSYSTTWPELMRRLDGKKSQMWGLSWGADYPDPQNFFQLFYGPNKAPGVNKSCYDNDEFNGLYEKARVMLAGPERTKLYRRMEQIVADEVVWSFRSRRVNFNLVHPWLYGYRYNDMGQKYFKYCRVDPERRAAEVKKINKATLWPLFLFLALAIGIVAVTLVTARRRVRGW